MTPEQSFNPVLLQFALIFLIFYFLIFKPQKDKQKQHKEMINNLKKNDEIVTAGGLHGTIANVKDTSVIVRIDDNVKVEIDKEAISALKKKTTEA
ncbi:MAG: preprotein translocase subunit YajC [Candidatus Omnitrophota bacterium]